MENSTQATSGALYGLAQELIRGFGPKRRFSQQLEPDATNQDSTTPMPAGTLKNRAGTRTGGANGIFTVRENGSRAQHQIPKRESLAPGRGVEKSLAPRSGRHVLLREKSRRYLELQNEESDLSDGGNENQQSKIRVGEAGVRTRTELLIQNRDFPDPA
jgi:hypothetical protein